MEKFKETDDRIKCTKKKRNTRNKWSNWLIMNGKILSKIFRIH